MIGTPLATLPLERIRETPGPGRERRVLAGSAAFARGRLEEAPEA